MLAVDRGVKKSSEEVLGVPMVESGTVTHLPTGLPRIGIPRFAETKT
jgi:hypothetical protein